MERGAARRVVVGFDGTLASPAALRWAAGEARLHRAELVAYTITHDDGRALLQPPSPALTGGYPLSVYHEAGEVPACLRAACTPDDRLVLGRP
jgi:nucleotide-binding universal stress UspA family protein